MTEEFLYHYTTLDKLALILKNRTIRLSPLDKMDDLQENMTGDVKNFGKIFFASSWTDDESESIPMWKMYAPMESGVRIGLPKNPFKHYSKHIVFKQTGETFEDFILIPSNKYYEKGLYTPQYDSKDLLVEVKYTKDKKLLEPQILTDDEKGLLFDIFGRYKNEYWSFQKEWRYLIYFIKPDVWNKGTNFFKDICEDNISLPIEFFDLEIDDKCFGKMEILVSPQMSEGNDFLLDMLIEKYNPSATKKYSELKGTMRN